ncbi:MAG: ATP-binding cassette domain-containing protein, partial [Peptococcaceae bacterium]|nr:ATP-binding cassette domain-containing protein [Peptococcaceae bacterium]
MSLELKHVSHIYQEGSAKESYALRDICLNVNEGEFLGIAGHTGSGKSTLIQHFNGL